MNGAALDPMARRANGVRNVASRWINNLSFSRNPEGVRVGDAHPFGVAAKQP
jgi:hypothetical protein